MEYYLEQLIYDIRQTTNDLNPDPRIGEEQKAMPDREDDQDESYIDQYLYGEKEPISKITGIHCDLLPAPERLTPQQQECLAPELEALLDHFHFKLEFPSGFPAHLRYPFIRKFWSEDHVPLSLGYCHIEFCNYGTEDCPFPGYCTICTEIDAQIKFEENCGSRIGFDLDIEAGDLQPTSEETDEWAKEQCLLIREERELDEFFAGIKTMNPLTDSTGGLFSNVVGSSKGQELAVPALCALCRKNSEDKQEVNLLCRMKRFDQRDEPVFKCGVFESLH